MITQNYINIIKDILQRAGDRYGAYPLIGIGSTHYTTQVATLESDERWNGKDFNVLIGSGDTPATRNDYQLASEIVSGFSKSVAYSHAFDNNGDHVLIMDVTVTNTGSDPFTIREIGYVLYVRVAEERGGSLISNLLDDTLVDRTVLDTPVTINPNETKRLRYTLKTIEI